MRIIGRSTRDWTSVPGRGSARSTVAFGEPWSISSAGERPSFPEAEGGPLSPFVGPLGKEPLQACRDLRLLPDLVAEPRPIAGNDAKNGPRHQIRSRGPLFEVANRVERTPPPRIVRCELFGGDLPLVPHRGLEKSSLRQRHPDAE